MGRYIEYGDVAGRYSQIVKFSTEEDVGSHFILYAEADVDAALSKVYSTPFDTSSGTPPTVADLAIDLTYVRAAVGKSKTVDKLKESIIKRIKAIQDGTMAIVDTTGAEILRVGDAMWSSTADYTPIFGLGDTLDFVVDEDRIDAEDDARD